MERQEEDAMVNLEMCRPRLELEEGVSRRFDDSDQGALTNEDDSRLIGATVAFSGDAEGLATREVPVQMVVGLEAIRSTAARNSQVRVTKPRRGRPPRSQGRPTPAYPLPRRKKDEEDVCFICFDGGNLVLCDRQ